MEVLRIFLMFMCSTAMTLAMKQSYDGYVLVELNLNNGVASKYVEKWSQDPEFDIWNERQQNAILVLLSPSAFQKYKTLFSSANLTYKIVENNIQKFIDLEALSMASVRMQTTIHSKVVAKYASYDDVTAYMDEVAQENPEFLSSYNIGQTVENRTIKALLFKTQTTKRSIWMNCGIHAREWITIASCTYVIDKLINEYKGKNEEITDLLNYYEIHVVPILNPDGYMYSRTVKRLWRKNRASGSNNVCMGVDLNRNFPFKWMLPGASSSPCSDTYAGSSEASEPETKAVENIIKSQKGKWDVFLDIHSFGLWYLFPYGYTKQKPDDYAEMLRVATISAKAIETYNQTKFTIGSTANILYLASGSSIDWAYAEMGILYSYCLELRPRMAEGLFGRGFLIPETVAPHAGEELYRGIIEVFKEAKKKAISNM